MHIVGRGIVRYDVGGVWTVYNGNSNVFIKPCNFIGCRPVEGLEGILTYEYNARWSSSCVNCFRRCDDPALRAAEAGGTDATPR
jgi:hypothetical protein